MPELQEINAEQAIIGEPSRFAIGYAFIGDDRTTEMSMYADGVNLLGFTRGGQHLTTRWAYLEGLVAWLKRFAMTMRDDPYPMDVEGEFAAEKDSNARTFESDDLDELDAYYDPICDWAYEHSWASERAGAIVSDMLFECRHGMVELSWDNRSPEDGVSFDCEFGGVRVDAEVFKSVVLGFVDTYERHWGIKVDDESTWVRK